MSELRNIFSEQDIQKLEGTGMEINPEKKSGDFKMIDQTGVTARSFDKNLTLLPLKKALKDMPGLKTYFWKLVDPDKDEYTRKAYNSGSIDGYLIHLKKNTRVRMPFQACFFIKELKSEQIVHNIIILEENSELHIINGCISGNYVLEGSHIGITEIYLKKDSFLSYTMIHDWSPRMTVRPRSAAEIGENAQYISNYISLKSSRSTQTHPVVTINGPGGKARLNSILFAPGDTDLDVGGKIILSAEGSRGDIISRIVSDGGNIKAPAEIEALTENVSGYMDCSGLLLGEKGNIYSIPALNAKAKNVELSHEASVGSIGQEEINYLMSKGISEENSRNLILQGFLDLKIKGLPPQLQESIDDTIAKSVAAM